MAVINLSEINQYIKNQSNDLHALRLKVLKKFDLEDTIKERNPYILHGNNILISGDLVKILLDAYLSSQEETIFGNFLEGLAIFVNQKVYKGWKSSTQGIDLEFNKDKIRYIVAIKSGPNWGNSSQIRKMQDDFLKAKKTMRTNNSKLNIIAINGCCYGRDNKPDKGDFYKYCGQKFWEFISGNTDLYLKIIVPLGYLAKEKNLEFQKKYAQLVNRFTMEFSKDFVKNGEIDWKALLKFNSAESK